MWVHSSCILKCIIIMLILFCPLVFFVAWLSVCTVVETHQYCTSTSPDITKFWPYYYINYSWLCLYYLYGTFDHQVILMDITNIMFCSLKFTIAVCMLLCNKGLKHVMYVHTYLCGYAPLPWGISAHQ